MGSERSRTVILDRDGVINADSAHYIRRPQQWRALPGALAAIAALTRNGWRIFVATNQSGVGRGLFSAADLEAIHQRMLRVISAAGGTISGIYHCPHTPDHGCDCRKPKPGLLLRIGADEGIELGDVPFIGDKPADAEAAIAAGARPILVGPNARAYALARGIAHFSDLQAAVAALLEGTVEPSSE